MKTRVESVGKTSNRRWKNHDRTMASGGFACVCDGTDSPELSTAVVAATRRYLELQQEQPDQYEPLTPERWIQLVGRVALHHPNSQTAAAFVEIRADEEEWLVRGVSFGDCTIATTPNRLTTGIAVLAHDKTPQVEDEHGTIWQDTSLFLNAQRIRSRLPSPQVYETRLPDNTESRVVLYTDGLTDTDAVSAHGPKTLSPEAAAMLVNQGIMLWDIEPFRFEDISGVLSAYPGDQVAEAMIRTKIRQDRLAGSRLTDDIGVVAMYPVDIE